MLPNYVNAIVCIGVNCLSIAGAYALSKETKIPAQAVSAPRPRSKDIILDWLFALSIENCRQ
jgi:hypothetical protein